MAVSPAYTPITLLNTFDDWRTRTNDLSNDLSVRTLTVDATVAGASVIGNSSLAGNFDCLTLSVGTALRGGNNTNGATLNIVSNTIINSTSTLTVSGPLNSVSTVSFTGPAFSASAATTVNLNGTTTANNLTVTGVATFINDVNCDITGNANTANRLFTPVTIDLIGDVTGSYVFDGSSNVAVTTALTASPTSILANIITVDGAGSGLDADLLDGIQGAGYLRSNVDSTFDGNLIITKNLTVNSTDTLTGGIDFSTQGDLLANQGKLYARFTNGFAITNLAGGGTTASANTVVHNFNINGDYFAKGNVTAYSTVTQLSDKRYKKDIATIQNALEVINNLRGVSYKRVEDDTTHYGVIAQEVKEVIPEAVINNNEFMSVSYSDIIGVLIEAVKELSKKVEKLESKKR